MMKPKEALVKDGFLPAGSENARGRLSGAGIERCKALASAGWEIEGYSVTDKPDTTGAATIEKVKAPTGGKEIADIGEPFHHEDAWEAHTPDGPLALGIKAVCNNCKNSLTYCPCPKPVVNVDWNRTSVVTFKPKR